MYWSLSHQNDVVSLVHLLARDITDTHNCHKTKTKTPGTPFNDKAYSKRGSN